MRLILALLAASAATAETHTVIADQYHHTFSRSHAVVKRIRPGDTVATKTVDSAGFDFSGVRRTKTHGNPLTGPFFIEGAEPGDALLVRLNRVRLNRRTGYTAHRMSAGAVTPDSVPQMPGPYTEGLILPGRGDLLPWDIDIERAVVRLREPTDGRLKLEFPAAPMLGCIGVAPAGDFSPTSGPSSFYGGNMDYWEIREGVEVWLPVYHEGGLLFMGDGHALQGHGEVVGSGVETSLDVEFTVTLRKNARIGNPRVVTQDHIISIGAVSDSSLNRGLQIATTDLARWIESDYGVGRRAVHQLLGMQIRYDVATLAGAVAAKVEKKWLPAPISPRP